MKSANSLTNDDVFNVPNHCVK